MFQDLKQREKAGQPIQVGLIGAGAMGLGIALQIKKTPGMELSFIADINLQAAEKAMSLYGKTVPLYENAEIALRDPKLKLDVLVESTNAVGLAARYCLQAIARKAHVVLMNAEVDLVLGPYLCAEAKKQGVVVTSDAGDQHGVLKRMIDEIQLWGFDITQAGNIKGFLDRYATAESKREIAKQLRLNLTQCVAYTDGTKLNIEMALIGSGVNLTPKVKGMQGPKAGHVTEALELFDFDSYQGQGYIDYLLGAKPGGGVYVIGHCDDKVQAEYLTYYKVQNRGPYYLFYRPYHLCHLETPRAIAKAVLYGKSWLEPSFGRLNDVYTYAKQPLVAGAEFTHGIGDDLCYGLVETTASADQQDRLPVGLLTTDGAKNKPRLIRNLDRDAAITWADVELPETELLALFKKQQAMLDAEQEVIA